VEFNITGVITSQGMRQQENAARKKVMRNFYKHVSLETLKR